MKIDGIEPYLKNAMHLDVKSFGNRKNVEIEYADGKKVAGDIVAGAFHPCPVKGLSSIIEHFARGHYGNTSWRGNCSGLLIKDLMQYYKPNFVIDPMCGSGTAVDVCNELKTPCLSLDLNPKYGGFDALKDELPRSADFIFCHPPYFVFPGSKMPMYSGHIWGKEEDPDDGSVIHDKNSFTQWFNRVQANLFQALRNGGRAIYLIGDSRFHGQYYSMFKEMDIYGTLENVMIKRQFNCMSDNTAYSRRFIPIEHEYVVIVRKDDVRHMRCLLVHTRVIDFSQSKKITWRSLIQLKLETLGGKATRKQIFDAVAMHPKARGNQHIQDKIRQVINMFPQEFIKDGNVISLAA